MLYPRCQRFQWNVHLRRMRKDDLPEARLGGWERSKIDVMNAPFNSDILITNMADSNVISIKQICDWTEIFSVSTGL